MESGWKRCVPARGMVYRPTLRAGWWVVQSATAGLQRQTSLLCPIRCTSAAATQHLAWHVALCGVLCAATEFRLYQDENIIVLNSSVSTAASRNNPSLCDVYATDSGNHTSGLVYLPSLGSLRTSLWIYPLGQSEGQFTPWDKLETEL